MKKHIKYLESLSSCKEGVDFADDHETLQKAWDKCERGDWMLWLLGKQVGPVGSESRKKIVFVAEQCARLALLYTKDDRVLKCIEACEAYYRSEIDIYHLRNARDAAAYAAYAAYAAAARNKIRKETADIVRKYYPEICEK